MSTFLPQDANEQPIPALKLKPGGAHAIASSDSSNANTTAFDSDTKIVSIYATAAVYIAFGGSDVAATSDDHYFPAGIYYDVSIGDEKSGHATHIAVLRVDTNGTVYVSEKT